MPNAASGMRSRGDMKYNKAAMKQTKIRNRNIQIRPPNVKTSRKAWRSNVGKSRM